MAEIRPICWPCEIQIDRFENGKTAIASGVTAAISTRPVVCNRRSIAVAIRWPHMLQVIRAK
jgi:hypothetical protein